MADRTRKYRLTLYLNENEKYILENKVKVSGLKSKGAFLRNLIIYGYVYDIDYKYLHDYSVELSRIGNLLNQIAKRANTTGNVYQNDIKEVKELMEKIWHKLRRDIDAIIKLSDSYEDFLLLMRQKGYEIKGGEPDSTLKYISFRPAGKERFVRGSEKSLGAAYTRENITEQIHTKDKKRAEYKQRSYASRTLIDTSASKFTESAGLKHWADIENLKIAASAYADVTSISALEQQLADKKVLSSTSKSDLVALEHKMKSYAEILKYAEQYTTNKPYHLRYLKSKNPDEYFRRHESELLLYDGAKNVLHKSGINLKNIDIGKMRDDYHAMEMKKAELQKTYKAAEKDISDMERKMQNLRQYLELHSPAKESEQEKNQTSHTL